MKKLFLLMTVGVISLAGYSQTGKNEIGVGVDLGIPNGDFGDYFKLGFGGYLKGLYGVGSAGQITFTTGYTTFSAKDEYVTALSADKIKASIIPLLAGYRHNFSGFYAEPQVGYGIYGSKVTAAGQKASDSEGAFTWAVGLGYAMSGFDIGARYQSASKNSQTTSVIGIRVGYNFSLGGK